MVFPIDKEYLLFQLSFIVMLLDLVLSADQVRCGFSNANQVR